MGKLKRKGIFKSIFNGVLDVAKVTVLAPLEKVVDVVKENVDSPQAGEGKIDVIRIAFALGIIVSIGLFAFGKISFEDLERLIKLLY